MNKKRICLITNWYPTKENPYAGLFFKEQAFATEEYLDYLVVHYQERRKCLLLSYLVRRLLKTDVLIRKDNEEKNTQEYTITVWCPVYLALCDLVYRLIWQFGGTTVRNYLHRHIANPYTTWKKKKFGRIFCSQFEEPFDVLYCVDAQQESSMLRMVSEIRGVPYIVSEHAPFPWPGTIVKPDEKEAIADADLFLAISYDKIRQVMLQDIKLKKIAYVGNLVDDSQFRLAHGESDEKTFIMVAASSFYKNYDLFYRVFERLTEITETPFKVIIVGYGANKGYSQNAHGIERAAQESSFAKYAELIPEIAHECIHELYQRADAFVMTSIQEGQPVSALEAACCGLPIFSTICGGVEDYVTEDIGRLYKMEDVERFANGLKDFVEGRLTFDSVHIRETTVAQYGKTAFVNNFVGAVMDILTCDSDTRIKRER